MSEINKRYLALLRPLIDEDHWRSVILSATQDAKRRNRKQVIISVFEAGLATGINVETCGFHEQVLANADIPWDSPPPGDDDDFEPYLVGGELIEQTIRNIIENLETDSSGIDYILTTHDGAWHVNLRTGKNYEGDIDWE